MERPDLTVVEGAGLPYLLSLPPGHEEGSWPVLCFLHGLGEGAPMDIRRGLTAHGPLRKESSPLAQKRFVVVAPQLPWHGDIWHCYGDEVRRIVTEVQSQHGGDPSRSYLTGFSFGGNGVFDLALAQPDLWAALWAVDPTRVPSLSPQVPIWLSVGSVSRPAAIYFARALHLRPDEEPLGERVAVDQGEDHAGSARLAYGDDRIYRWLLSQTPPPWR